MSESGVHTLEADETPDIHFLDILIVLARYRRMLLLGPILIGIAVYGCTYLITPVYTAKTLLIPPQHQSGNMSILQSLGGLAGMAGAAAIKNPQEQYAALLQSNMVADRMADKFKLDQVYETTSRQATWRALSGNVQIAAARKDGLMSIEVDDTDPNRAAAMANEYAKQLQVITSELAVTEAQQRRLFFDKLLQAAKDKLTEAQKALQGSGINEGAIRAEPRAAADAYGSLQAQVTAAEVQLQNLRGSVTENAFEFKQAWRRLTALREQLARLEGGDNGAASSDYISKYREFKYQEALFDLYAKQYELAKLDESREGPVVQVVDAAVPPELKSKPRRLLMTAMGTVGAGVVLLMLAFLRDGLKRMVEAQENAEKLAVLRAAMK